MKFPRLSPERIVEAAEKIDPAFLNSPYFHDEKWEKKFELSLGLKVETLNPIRSFKGRGADYFFATCNGEKEFVCASVGNFGQGMAYAARKRNLKMTVFAAQTANPLKIESMRQFGANVILEGDDFEMAKRAAMKFAEERGAIFVADGRDPAISEGAGTIALEMLRQETPDVILVPLGNGALVNGVGTHFKHASPKTEVIAVVASGAPCMYLSWKEKRPISTSVVATIADGIGIREPIPEALIDLEPAVDNIITVTDDWMIEAMRHALFDLGLLLEPAGATGLAALLKDPSRYKGKKVATILTGANINKDQIKQWLM